MINWNSFKKESGEGAEKSKKAYEMMKCKKVQNSKIKEYGRISKKLLFYPLI